MQSLTGFMDLNCLKTFCQKLNQQEYVEKPPTLRSGEDELQPEPVDEVIIKKTDVVNLINFAQVWTDVLEIDEVIKQFHSSPDYTDLAEFENDNFLYNLGFFYVRVNTKCSALEILGLLEPIAFEQFRTPGTNLISYSSLTELFGDKMEKQTMQLMVLGDHFKYWTLVNPFTRMKSSREDTKLILSAMGSLAVLIVPGYFKSCFELVREAETNFLEQKQSGQTFLN